MKRLKYLRQLFISLTVALLMVPTSHVYAYTSSYFASRVYENNGWNLSGLQGMQVVAKGDTLYVSSYFDGVIYRINSDKTEQIIAGIPHRGGYSPDGSIAANSTLQDISSIAVANDGTVYFAEGYAHLVRAILPNGLLTTIAGNGSSVDASQLTDASNARQTPFDNPTYVKVGPDGNLYVSDSGVIRRILAGGSTDHVAGTFGAANSTNPYVEGGMAAQHMLFPNLVPDRVPFAFDSKKNLYLTTGTDIYEVSSSDGTVHTFSTRPNTSVNTLEDEPVASVLISTMEGFDIDSSDQIWTGGGGSSIGNAIQHLSLTDQIVRTAAGGGSTNLDPLHHDYTPIAGTDLALPYAIKSLSVSDTGKVYYIAAFNNPTSEPTYYIGVLATDSTPPVITTDTSPNADTNGWNSLPTTLSWNVVDSESPITSQTGCSTTTITSSGTYTCTATSGGGTSSQSVTIKIDPTPPVIQNSLSPTPNSNGWNNSNTAISWSVSDPESPITNQSGCGSTTVTTETTSTIYTCTATSGGGTSSQSITIKLDKTPPTVSTPTVSGGLTLPLIGNVFIGNTGTVNTNISDNLSGVAGAEYYVDNDPGRGHGTSMSVSSGKASVSIDTSKLSPGAHNLYVRDYDNAGNWSASSTPVVVTVL